MFLVEKSIVHENENKKESEYENQKGYINVMKMTFFSID